MRKSRPVRESRFPTKLVTSIILALFVGIALYFRIILPYDKVFVGDWIKFTGNDAYYHMRLVDSLVANFPHFTTFDPYFVYPGASGPTSLTFFQWFLGSLIWLIGRGAPAPHMIDVIGAYFPAVLGALTIIPVYFIGKELLGRWAGILSAGLLAFLPGEFLGRSILGFTDQHVAETLFTTITMLFLILAIKTAPARELSFRHFHWRDWMKSIIYSKLAGLFLGIYIFTWLGALLFVFIITLYFVIQFTIDHLRKKSTDYLAVVGVVLFLVTLIIFWPILPSILYLPALIIALLIPLGLNGLSRLMVAQRIKPAYYPITLVGLGLVGLGLFYLIDPLLLRSMLSTFSIFAPQGASLTTLEMQPILFPASRFTFSIIWGNFPGLLSVFVKTGDLTLGNVISFMTTTFFFSVVSLVVLVYFVARGGDREKSLLVVWSIVMVAATLGQRRFAYYLAVNVALLTGYLAGRILEFTGVKELPAPAARSPKVASSKKVRPRRGGFRFTLNQVTITLVLVITFFVIFFPNIAPAIAVTQAPFAASNAWMSSLDWLRENTPEPFGNPQTYYQRYQPPPAGTSYHYPASAYGVMAWWDYGYWITRIARRLPNANPSQDPRALTSVASFFIAQDETSANQIARQMDSAYVIIDSETATSKFWAIVTWAGRKPGEFFDGYWSPQDNSQKFYIYPEYYQSLVSRLYNFDGKAVTPVSTLVISYQVRVNPDGTSYREVLSEKQFTSYAEAEAYRLSQKSGNYQIVGTSPFASPVPLAALEHYKLIYGSGDSLTLPDGKKVPAVKIFEYID